MISDFSGRYDFLSNFYRVPGGIEYEGLTYPTVEHAFQAAKTLNPDQRFWIAQLATPRDAKRAGKHLQLRPMWNSIRVDTMAHLLRIKFSNPILEQLLLDTGDEILVEGNWWGDWFWGATHEQTTAVDKPDCYRRWGEYTHFGCNHLGRLLMEIRKEKCAARRS